MTKRGGFTLIEVMIAVMIISVVISALLQMRGNSALKFASIKDLSMSIQYSTFLLANSSKYGFENDSISMKNLVDDFDLESDLRRRLKFLKVEVLYDEVSSLGDENESVLLEIGRTTLKTEKFSNSVLRIRLK